MGTMVREREQERGQERERKETVREYKREEVLFRPRINENEMFEDTVRIYNRK